LKACKRCLRRQQCSAQQSNFHLRRACICYDKQVPETRRSELSSCNSLLTSPCSSTANHPHLRQCPNKIANRPNPCSATSRSHQAGFAEAQYLCDAAPIALMTETVTPPALSFCLRQVTRLTCCYYTNSRGPDHQFVNHKQRLRKPRPLPPLPILHRSPIFTTASLSLTFPGRRPNARRQHDLQINVDLRHLIQ
jgi:hypothetical protein